jgi:hypothetical protein
LGDDGQIVEEDRIPTSTGALERAFKKMSATRVVVEAGISQEQIANAVGFGCSIAFG